jgi:hypothetical protein
MDENLSTLEHGETTDDTIRRGLDGFLFALHSIKKEAGVQHTLI